jgi:tetratricopeptide (TPR) repeat protein
LSSGELAALTARVSALEAQNSALASQCELMEAYIASLRQPDDLGQLQKIIALLKQQNIPEPDDIQERGLRLLLRDDPLNFEYSRALIALLRRTGRPLFPDFPAALPEVEPQDPSGIDELLRLSEGHARTGDTLGVYAALWQACVRYPRTARGWAEFARCLADRREWSNCRIAAERVLEARSPDESTATAMLSTLSTLAEHGELAALDWKGWLAQLPARLQVHPHVANILHHLNDAAGAAAILPNAVKEWPANSETWIYASVGALEAGRPHEVYEHMRRAFTLDPAAAVRAMTGDNFSHSFAVTMRSLGKSDELADWISERSAAFEGINLVSASPAPEAKLAVQNSRRTAMERGLPSALLVTLAKSASVSVGSIFSTGFELPTVLYSLAQIRVVLPWLQDYLKGGACYVNHLVPSARNVDLLVAGGAPSVIVHVRDPRQWVVAMAGHLRLYQDSVPPVMRETALGGPENAIAYAIRDMLPDTIAWIDGWVKAREKLPVNFTTFEDFIRDREEFLDRILSYYGGDRRFFDREKAFAEQPGTDYHRRRGLIDEWKDVLNREQIEQINNLIPNEFWNLFGWEP